VSILTEGTQNAYDLIPTVTSSGKSDLYEIYHLVKRGKQHVHAGTVTAGSVEEAMSAAKQTLNTKQVFNIWAIKQSDIRFTSGEEQDLWNTLPEKRFRDAADYKGGDKLKTFLEKQKVS
ncbi:MAG TPA: phenylacetic acid degradation b, partial [Cyclobacteriaceae bacterium]|nr:phenylacetic acid degradation b [Cyclobacteriaceae bacterium]